MIPLKMWFGGIRDYDSTSMDLSGKQDHILITGPNGAGKSTITYCMGAVLYSSKVELEGLRSQNLAPDEIWKAHIRLLFRNEGHVRIDAPKFIEFSINILQEPGQPIKKEFVISSGDNSENWEEVVRYTSGDRQYNFTAYKKDLQYKYKIDPDLFYLIWYQQEVNQFAVMHPEGRFRIFAEMHGIDQVQRNWEESVEKLTETQEILRVAESNVANKKQWLKIKKTELDRYEDNQRRLLKGGKLYAASLLRLEEYYNREKEQLNGQIEQLKLEKEQQQEHMDEMSEQEVKVTGQVADLQQKVEQLTDRVGEYDNQLQTLESDRKSIREVIAELELELQEVSKEKERITRTEDEVKRQLADAELHLNDTINREEELKVEIKEYEGLSQEHTRAISRQEADIELEKEHEVLHRERLQQYVSSYHVQEELDLLDQLLLGTKDKRHEYSKRIHEFQEELARLEDEHDWSRRQMDSLSLFNSRGIKAYALSDLVELDGSVKLKSEEQFNSIKYTIFFDAHMVAPPNDLYHVPLRKLVPDRSLTEVPELQLRVKEGLTEEVLPHAMKALWWMEQFFKGGEVSIEHGVLIDSMGIRGSQEQNRYILSTRALILRKEEVKRNIRELMLTSEELDESIKLNTKRSQELNSMIQSVREAEAFMTREHERVNKVRKLKEQTKELEELFAYIDGLKQVQRELLEQLLKLEHVHSELQEEAEFYVRLGQQKEKFEELNVKVRHLQGIKEQYEELRNEQEDCENQLDKLEQETRKQQRALEGIQYSRHQDERKLHQMNKQLEARSESLDTAKGEFILTIKEIEELKQLIPHIYNEVVDGIASAQADSAGHLHQLSLTSEILMGLEKGRTQFNHARQESDIDPVAPENYKIIEEEYSRLQDEYKRMNILFQQDQERAEQLKNQLETTINMRVLEIQQRFKSYMSLFQFEGVIEWDQYEDRRGRTHFDLYIKARKEGHRGTLEDVSVKARGGKVGKGVSGGEESLSSLLFALALLQNLQTAPGFIVLDEFDSALDEQRKLKVFDLYRQELERKLIILTPKSHEKSYLDRYSKAYIVHHDPTVPRSKVTGIVKTD